MKENQVPFALLVIDVQQALFKRSTPIYNAQSFLENLKDLIDHSRQQGALIVYVQHANDSLLRKGTQGWQLHRSLHPLPDDLHIHKLHGSAFKETELAAELDKRDIRELVICGLVTHGCVKAGCLDALDRGYPTTLISDGHSNYSKGAAKLIAKWNGILEKAGAKLCSTAEFIQQ